MLPFMSLCTQCGVFNLYTVSGAEEYVIPAGAVMLLAIIFFVMGSSGYVHVPPTESPMMRVAKVVYAAVQNR